MSFYFLTLTYPITMVTPLTSSSACHRQAHNEISAKRHVNIIYAKFECPSTYPLLTIAGFSLQLRNLILQFLDPQLQLATALGESLLVLKQPGDLAAAPGHVSLLLLDAGLQLFDGTLEC